MKKIASIVAAALMTCSISACGNRNTAYRTPTTQQGKTNFGMNQGNYNAGVGNTVAFKDGVYLGEGNRTSRGNEAAIIRVTGGRITDVTLKTLDAQGREIYTNGTPGNANGVGANTAGGTTVGNTTGVNPNTGRTGGTTNGAITGGSTGRTTTTTNLDRVTSNLANAVVSQQTHNVTVNNPGTDASSVNNWKLAVSRALESARK